jgi:putative hydrolase
MDNRTIARRLNQYARQLEKDQANLYRIKAYRRAAESIERLTTPVADLVAAEGAQGLRRLPGIGDHLSFAIERLLATGDFHILSANHAEVPPDEDVRSLPGVGPHLAELLWEQLGIRTIGELEQADQDQRLDEIHLSARRRDKLRQALRKRHEEQTPPTPGTAEPPVAVLLEIDRDYRRLARKKQLPTIAPEKFNPSHESWLPLYFVRRRGWKFRALFANTALAHRLGRAGDWVVIYFSNDEHRGQRMVVTEYRGALRGQRVVRGREAECRSK